MKRYKLDNRDANSERNLWESADGEWVEYEDAKRLIEELATALESCMEFKTMAECISAEEVLKKARDISNGKEAVFWGYGLNWDCSECGYTIHTYKPLQYKNCPSCKSKIIGTFENVNYKWAKR